MKRLLDHKYRLTTLVAFFCVAALIGIGLARLLQISGWWIVPASLLGLVLMKQRSTATLLLVVLAGLCFGGYRGTVYMHRVHQYDALYGHTITVVGQASADAAYGSHTQLAFDLVNAQTQDSQRTKLVGTIGAGGFGENMIFRGDTVVVTGKLRPAQGSRQAWLTFAQLHVLQRDSGRINSLRRRFNAGILSALPEPLGSFAMGLLIGQQSNLPKEIYQELLMVGLVHIIAVSGYNLTIILRASLRLFGKRSKYQTLAMSLLLIGVFLLFTGSSASIVRAAIVSGLSLLAWYYGRSFKPLVLLSLAAAITALARPLYVWGDMGWYLSFLAFYGVMVLAPLVKERFVPERFRELLPVSIALESLCAEIMTIPIVLFVFGQMSLISLVANVLIAILVPLAMLLSFVAGIAGMLLLPIAGWFAWPATVLLTYMLDMAHLLSRVPHVFLQNLSLSLTLMLGMYGVIVLIVLMLRSHVKRNRAIITVVNETNLQRDSVLNPAAIIR